MPVFIGLLEVYFTIKPSIIMTKYYIFEGYMDNASEKQQETITDELEYIEKSGSIKSDNIHCISIIGQIEGHYVLPSEQKTTK